ncbi:MAG: purine-nucleoside phosphorylase [Elusimicrobiales bacterium]|nr:purine-nucleoside phosphorylase [Elusimicrobiales bacterium]
MNDNNELARIKKAVKWINGKTKNRKPLTAIITGSGLSDCLPDLTDKVVLPYKNIPGFPTTTVKGHKGELVFGNYKGKQIVIMRGRFHFYEGCKMSFIAMPIRVLGFLGVKNLIVTAAVGSLRPAIKPGEIVLLNDHINMTGDNPLIGNYNEKFGAMFPDMSNPYDKKLLKIASKAAKKLKIKIKSGVYFAVSGPSYETAKEVGVYRMLGGDVVGMSVVPEVIAARQMKINVLGISWVSNFTTGISNKIIEHKEVLELGGKVSLKIKALIEAVLASKSTGGSL